MFEDSCVLRKGNSGKTFVAKSGGEPRAVADGFSGSCVTPPGESLADLSEDASAALLEDAAMAWSRAGSGRCSVAGVGVGEADDSEAEGGDIVGSFFSGGGRMGGGGLWRVDSEIVGFVEPSFWLWLCYADHVFVDFSK